MVVPSCAACRGRRGSSQPLSPLLACAESLHGQNGSGEINVEHQADPFRHLCSLIIWTATKESISTTSFSTSKERHNPRPPRTPRQLSKKTLGPSDVDTKPLYPPVIEISQQASCSSLARRW
ncbi:hypothetical protein SLA2020_391100 [Shorea laevis]